MNDYFPDDGYLLRRNMLHSII